MSTGKKNIKDEVSPCEGSTMISALWKQKNGEGKAESEHRGGRGRPDTLASRRGKKWKKRRREEYKEIWLLLVSHLTFVYEERGSNLCLSLLCSTTFMPYHNHQDLYVFSVCFSSSPLPLIRQLFPHLKEVIDFPVMHAGTVWGDPECSMINTVIDWQRKSQWGLLCAKDCITKWFNRLKSALPLKGMTVIKRLKFPAHMVQGTENSHAKMFHHK